MLVVVEEQVMLMEGKLMEEQYMLVEVQAEAVEEQGKLMGVHVQVHTLYIHHLLASLQFVLELVKIDDNP